MSTASFEFSAAEAQAVPVKKTAAVSKNPKLDLSLDEISKNERKERIEAKKQNAKGKADKKEKTTKGNDRKPKDHKKNSSDIKVREDKREKKTDKKEFKINIPENIVKDFLEQAGIRTDKYNVSVYAIPRRHD